MYWGYKTEYNYKYSEHNITSVRYEILRIQKIFSFVIEHKENLHVALNTDFIVITLHFNNDWTTCTIKSTFWNYFVSLFDEPDILIGRLCWV